MAGGLAHGYIDEMRNSYAVLSVTCTAPAEETGKACRRPACQCRPSESKTSEADRPNPSVIDFDPTAPLDAAGGTDLFVVIWLDLVQAIQEEHARVRARLTLMANYEERLRRVEMAVIEALTLLPDPTLEPAAE